MIEQTINGKSYVLVPKDAWEKILEVFDKIEKKGE